MRCRSFYFDIVCQVGSHFEMRVSFKCVRGLLGLQLECRLTSELSAGFRMRGWRRPVDRSQSYDNIAMVILFCAIFE